MTREEKLLLVSVATDYILVRDDGCGAEMWDDSGFVESEFWVVLNGDGSHPVESNGFRTAVIIGGAEISSMEPVDLLGRVHGAVRESTLRHELIHA